MRIAEPKLIPRLHGTAGPGPGPDLTGYPHLTYAPAQWGEGVRIASSGAAIGPIAACATERPIEYAATIYGISTAEVLDALRYARAHEII
jgi:hypothetical protein